MAAQAQSSASPLAKLAVVEIAGETGARYCGRLLATLGARVVRVSRPATTDAAPGRVAFDAWLDEGKSEARTFEAACSALAATPDLVIVGQTREEVARVDALIESAALDTLRLGLTWFGPEGPYAHWKGDDALIQALIGIAHGFGAADGPPMMPQGRAPQFVAGATLFIAGMAALWGRRAGRKDRRVDVDVLEAALTFSETAPPSFQHNPRKAGKSGVNRSGANHPMSIYPSQDGWIGVTALTPAQWTSLCRLVERPEWADDPRFKTSLDRVAHVEVLDEELNRIFPTRPTDEWLMQGQGLRIPMAPVPRHIQLMDTPQWAGRGSFAPLPGYPGMRAPRLPFRMSFDGVTLPTATTPGAAPLSGLRVVDFSMGWAGPNCTRHLADLGADVLKIESHSHYDWWRGWEPPGASDPPLYELNPVFNCMNRGKRGVTLDLTTPAGVAAAKALVAQADVVIENYAPGVMDKLGLGHEVLQAAKPGLVMVSMGAFGATGPWSFFRAYGATVEQASGMPHANGQADWPPVLQHGAYGDPVAGIFGAVAALSGLHGRESLGGAWIDLAQVECLFQLGADVIISAQVDGEPQRLGSRSAWFAPRCVVQTADPEEPLAVVVTGEDQWRALCAVLGRPDWAANPALATPAGRNARGDEIEAELAAWAGEKPDGETAAQTLQTAGVLAAPVISSDRLAGHPQNVARGSWMHMQRRHVGRHIMAAPPYHIDGRRPAPVRPSPLLGEHSAEVLKEFGIAEPAVA